MHHGHGARDDKPVPAAELGRLYQDRHVSWPLRCCHPWQHYQLQPTRQRLRHDTAAAARHSSGGTTAATAHGSDSCTTMVVAAMAVVLGRGRAVCNCSVCGVKPRCACTWAAVAASAVRQQLRAHGSCMGRTRNCSVSTPARTIAHLCLPGRPWAHGTRQSCKFRALLGVFSQ